MCKVGIFWFENNREIGSSKKDRIQGFAINPLAG
jgi:hypothetical protein